MIEASFSSPMGSWSPHSILASFGSTIDRLTDITPSAEDSAAADGAPTGATVAFEHALAEELRLAGDVDPFGLGSDLQNGAVLGKAGETQANAAQMDRIDAGTSPLFDAAEPGGLASSHRRVGFGGDDSSSHSSASGDDHFDRAADRRDPAAFWVGDHVATHPAFRSLDSSFAEEPFDDAIPTGRVFFNGDGRPIILSTFDAADHDQPAAADTPSSDGDLMILPNGAVLAYDPWTASIDAPRQADTAAH